MADAERHPKLDRPDQCILPEFDDVVNVFKTRIPLLLDPMLVLSRAVAGSAVQSDDEKELMSRMFRSSFSGSVELFERNWYEKENPVHSIYDLEKSVSFVCGAVDEEISVKLFNTALKNSLEICAKTGLDIPVDVYECSHSVLDYFKTGTAKTVTKTGAVDYRLPSANGCEAISALFEFKAVRQAVAEACNVLSVYVSNSVYAGIFKYLVMMRGSGVTERLVYEDISRAAQQEIKACGSAMKAAQSSTETPADGGENDEISDLQVLTAYFMRVKCEALRGLVALAAVLFTEERFREKHPDVKRTRLDVFAGSCKIRDYYHDLLLTGIKGSELLEWTVCRLSSLLGIFVPHSYRQHFEARLMNEGAFDSDVVSKFPVIWKPGKEQTCDIDGAHRKYIQTHITRYREKVIPDKYEKETAEYAKKQAKKRKDNALREEGGVSEKNEI